MSRTHSEGTAQSVSRALDVLVEVAASPAETGVARLAAEVGLPVSTVHRLLATLVASGFVSQNPDTGRYRIGARAFEVGNAFLAQTNLVDVARPLMRVLQQEVDETVNLAVLDGDTAVYIDQITSRHLLQLFTRIGSRVALYCTGVGKVMMSDWDDADIAAYLATTDLKPRTEKTLVEPVALRHALVALRTATYAIDDEEFELGVRCVAAPIRDHHGTCIAALSVSAPAQRLTGTTLDQAASALVHTSHAISTQLGYRPPDQGNSSAGNPRSCQRL